MLLRTLCLLLTMGLLACSGSGDESVAEPSPTPVIPEPDPQPEPPPDPTPEPPPVPPGESYYADLYPSRGPLAGFGEVMSLTFESSANQLSYGMDSLQQVEFWPASPLPERESLPAIAFIHGGCWSNLYRVNQSYAFATALARNGFNVWSIEYRAIGDPGGGWPGTYQDIRDAIELIADQSQSYYSARPLIVIGHSAGGYLALLAGSQSNEVDFVIGMAAIVDLIDYADSSGACNSSVRSFMNGTPDSIPAEYAAATADLDSIQSSAKLFNGRFDGVIPLSQAQNSGLPTVIDTDAGHFDWIHPGTPAFDIILADLLNR